MKMSWSASLQTSLPTVVPSARAFIASTMAYFMDSARLGANEWGPWYEIYSLERCDREAFIQHLVRRHALSTDREGMHHQRCQEMRIALRMGMRFRR